MLLLLLLSHFSRVWLCATPQTAAHEASLSLGFSGQEHWSGLPFPSPMHESEKWKWRRSVVSDSSRPYGLQPTKLLRPWDFPGKNTGVICPVSMETIYQLENQIPLDGRAPGLIPRLSVTWKNTLIICVTQWNHKFYYTSWGMTTDLLLIVHC